MARFSLAKTAGTPAALSWNRSSRVTLPSTLPKTSSFTRAAARREGVRKTEERPHSTFRLPRPTGSINYSQGAPIAQMDRAAVS